ncbi:LpxI family protein [Aureimonas psammosilenae]|uniref:LpxI family protein n=1 Tax=Aureimonas psammosilenae TaxID=2495496 RepID=UPI001260B1E1|nr:UDP-2,3-diacylglucosamine diphosphatase LpxI [Aureimonas psammosilenae]
MAAEGSLLPSVPGEPLGIAGGGGSLPRIIADAAAANGWRPHILGVADGIKSDWSPYPSRPMAWGKLGDGLNWLRVSGARKLVLCGTVSVRPDFKSILPSWRTLMMMREIFGVMRGGDDNLLRAATRTFEARGFEVVGVQAIVPSLLAPDGLIAGHAPDPHEEAAISRGVAAATTLGALDIGQAIVASRDRVVALEGIEGTREMLHRVADLKRRGRIGRNERCVLVKCRKPDQDDRFDLPSIGSATVDEAAEAGLAGIAVTAGGSLVLGLDDVRQAAHDKGIFVVGRRTIPNGGEI